jgi:hypothetical protein
MKHITVSYDAEEATVQTVLEALNLGDLAVSSLSIAIVDKESTAPRAKPGRKPGRRPANGAEMQPHG